MSEYTAKTINNCKVIFGGIPIDDMTALIGCAPKDWVLNTQASRHLGAALVIGSKEDTESLMDLPPCYEVQMEVYNANASGMSKQAQEWLLRGERGMSSDTMFAVLSGSEIKDKSYPHDPSDLRRCRLLLDQVPEFAGRVGEIASVSKEWAGLVDVWELLCTTMDAECDWRSGTGSAPRTYNMMQECWIDPRNPKFPTQ